MRKNLFKKFTAVALSLTMVVGMAGIVPASVKKGTDISNGVKWSNFSIHSKEDGGVWEKSLIKDGQKFVGVDVTKESGIDASKTFGEYSKITTNTPSNFLMNVYSTGWSAKWVPNPKKKDKNGKIIWEAKGNNPWSISSTKIVKVEPGRTYNVSFKIKSTLVGEITESKTRNNGTTYNVKTGEKCYVKHVHVKFYRNNKKDGDPALPGTSLKATYKGKNVVSTTQKDCEKTKYTVIALDSRNDDYTTVTAKVTVPGDNIQFKKKTIGVKFAFGPMLFSFPKENNMKGTIEVKDFKMIAADKAATSKAPTLKAKKNAIKATAKKTKGAKSYEFQYSLKKTFVNKKTVKSKKRTVTLKGKKIKSKKKVYVRVRVKTKTGYTVWSNPKSVKVK